MDTALVREAYIRFYKDLKRRVTFDQPRCGTANRSGECIGRRHWGIKRWHVQSKRSVSCSVKLWKGNKVDARVHVELSPCSCCPAACRAALWLSPSKPEVGHGASPGQRR